jgi:hypothetical protein
VAEPKNPALPKMREWPMFRRPTGKREHKKPVLDGRAPPRIAELIMSHVSGSPAQKLAWLQQQKAVGNLDGDDSDEVVEAESLLAMLIRLAGSKGSNQKRHLDELLDEGLRETFPASDPVAVGHFTANEPPGRPIDSGIVDKTNSGKPRRRRRAA